MSNAITLFKLYCFSPFSLEISSNLLQNEVISKISIFKISFGENSNNNLYEIKSNKSKIFLKKNINNFKNKSIGELKYAINSNLITLFGQKSIYNKKKSKL